ncbi:ABC transporter permease [Dokdonella sp.]|uniref:ABC transporter permease n=1 Tax=Dokdonella sp. TaxID=2291710 RepID=UPI001B142F46|nr:ABC transporter permease [Dokdonella sp.]MBO9664870.1 ABC transporter permease [Dokdonella sp.]
MFTYYLQLGLRSLKRNPILTALMVVGIALGIAASMTTLTVMHLMGSDPIPWKSDKLHYVQLDSWSPDEPANDDGSPPDQVTYRDATALMEAAKADKQAAMFKLVLPVQPENPEVKPFQSLVRVTYTDFFGMFEPPFQYGGPWDRKQDTEHARVLVLSKDVNEKLFGGQDSVGKTVRMNGIDYSVVGVLDEWKLRSKYYDLTNGAFSDPEEMYMPFTTAVDLKQRGSGNNNCWRSPGNGWESYLESECVWMQMWVQLDSPARLAEYHSFLDNYVNEQKKLGRFQRPLNNRLLDVNQWMADQRVVSSDVQVQTGLGFAFLAVCLVNTIGLLLAKFTRKAGEVGLRRALGASRREVFKQFLIESGVIGLSGGLLGLLLTGLGLLAIRALYTEYRTVASLDWTMVLTTIVLAVASALLAGLYPTWRACRVQPAAQLKV